MLIKLIKFEFTKRWKALRYVLLGFILLQTLLLIITRSFFWDSNIAKVFVEDNATINSVPFALSMILYFLLTIFIVLEPFIEGLLRYSKDLSGKQAALELMIPIVSWKKIISKLITVLCSTVVCFGLATLSIVSFILINGNFAKSIVNSILNFIQSLFQSPSGLILASLYIIFSLISIYMLAFFCIAFSKAISHKNKIAVPLGIVIFVICVAVLSFINIQVQRIPIVEYNILGTEDSLSSTIVNVIVFLSALFGTSWLMEKRIEY